MTLPMNDDFANRELSIEELEAIAAGWPGWVHSAVHGLEVAAKVAVGVGLVALVVVGGYSVAYTVGNRNSLQLQ